MLKKISLAIILLNLCSAIFAETPTNKPYLGMDLEWNHFKYKDKKIFTIETRNFPKSNIMGFGIFGGYRWQTLGMEFGYDRLTNAKYVNNGLVVYRKSKESGYNLYLDGIYYYSIHKNISLKTLVGVGFLTTTFKNTMSYPGTYIEYSMSSSNFGPRLGAGFECYFNRNISSSLMYKIQNGNEYVDYLQTVALGLAYHF